MSSEVVLLMFRCKETFTDNFNLVATLTTYSYNQRFCSIGQIASVFY